MRDAMTVSLREGKNPTCRCVYSIDHRRLVRLVGVVGLSSSIARRRLVGVGCASLVLHRRDSLLIVPHSDLPLRSPCAPVQAPPQDRRGEEMGTAKNTDGRMATRVHRFLRPVETQSKVGGHDQ